MPESKTRNDDSGRTPGWFLGTGAFLLSIFFVLFVSELGRSGWVADSTPRNLQDFLIYYNFVLTPLLVVVAGSLGAYSQLTRNFASRIGSIKRSQALRQSEGRQEPALLYLVVGGLFGFLGGLVIPSALLLRGVDLTLFNPAALALLSALAGFFGVNSYSSLIDRIADELSNVRLEINSDRVTEAVQKALELPPLVNFDGYLACIIRTNLGTAMDGERAYLPPFETYLFADLTLTQSKPETSARTTRILVNQGIDPTNASAEAIFSVEVASPDIETQEAGELVVSRGTAHTTIPLEVSSDAAADSQEIVLTFYVSQSGRHIASMKLPITRTVPHSAESK
jgi:hypothetical protein